MRYLTTIEKEAKQSTYGIAAIENGKPVDWLRDVLPTFEETERLSVVLEENGVSAIHFRDVVRDLIVEREQ